MKRYRSKILGVSETKWTGQGRKSSEGVTTFYFGCETDHVGKVAIPLNREAVDALISWKPVSDRIITARLADRQ